MAGVSASRKAAFTILLAVERGTAHSDDLLRGTAVSVLSAPDRHLTTALVLGVLRWQILLDGRVRTFLTRPDARLDPEVLIALRLGAFQLLHLDRIPARAAIDESVELTKQSGHRFAARMVNAVLRKLASAANDKRADLGLKGTGLSAHIQAAEPGTLLNAKNKQPQILRPHRASRGSAQDDSRTAFLQHSIVPDAGCLPAVAAHPEWMFQRWIALFGGDTACAICRHNQEPPSLSVRLAAPEVETELIHAGVTASVTLRPGALLSSARTVTGGDIAATTPFREGRVRIQDEGSQLVAEIAASATPDTSEPVKILDVCAAPGGKTLILAERNPAARIVACEASPQRLVSLRERLAPLGDRVECRLANATALSFEPEFDVILADVPCSGTGTLSRNPEIRHRLRPEDLHRQAERQRAILVSALRAVRPGGRVVYSTCSLEPEENEQVIAAVLAQAGKSRIVPLGHTLDVLRDGEILAGEARDRLRTCVTAEGFLRLNPGEFGTDGFFVAMIENAK
jgi:16S rRNA (cytosine967-C5)-methyltransferase